MTTLPASRRIVSYVPIEVDIDEMIAKIPVEIEQSIERDGPKVTLPNPQYLAATSIRIDRIESIDNGNPDADYLFVDFTAIHTGREYTWRQYGGYEGMDDCILPREGSRSFDRSEDGSDVMMEEYKTSLGITCRSIDYSRDEGKFFINEHDPVILHRVSLLMMWIAIECGRAEDYPWMHG